MLVILAPDDRSRFFAGVPITGAMETIPDESFLDPFKRSGISRRGFGQSAMKGGVKDRELRHLAAQDFPAGPDPGQAVEDCGAAPVLQVFRS